MSKDGIKRLFYMSEIDSIIFNRDKYVSLLQNKMNKNIVESKSKDLILFDAFEQNIVDNKSINCKKAEIKKYASFLYKVFLKYPFVIYESILFDRENKYYFFNDEQISKINDYNNRMTNYMNNEISKIDSYKNGIVLPSLLIKYCSNNINKNSRIDKVYRYLLNNYESNSSVLCDEFIIKYTAYLAEKEFKVAHTRAYLSSYDFINSNKRLDCMGITYSDSGVLIINRDVLNGSHDIYTLKGILHAVCHEVTHYAQALEYKYGYVTKRNYIWNKYSLFNKYFKDLGLDEYNDNYDHYEIELDANYNGWDITYKILSKYAPKYKNSIINDSFVARNNELIKSITNTKHDLSDNTIMEDIDYNVYYLDRIIKNNPHLLSKSNVLNAVYKKDGSRRDFYELVNLEKDIINKESTYVGISDVFEEFYLYDINNNLFGIRLGIYNRDTNINVLNKILDLGIKEINELLFLKDNNLVSTRVRFNRYAKKIRNKIRRVNNIYDYIKNNRNYINGLGNKLIDTKILKFTHLINELNVKINKNNSSVFYNENVLKRVLK